MPTVNSRFDWFPSWVEQHLLLTLTVLSAPDPSRLLATFGPRDCDRGLLSLRAAYDIDEPTVRLGAADDGWTYAVEHRSTTAADSEFLERVTSDGSLAVTLCFTPTISGVHVARGGEYLAGFEPDAPDFMRWGSTPHAFDPQIQKAGLRHEDHLPPGAACASFLQLLTDVALTPAMLEDPLPCATLPALPRTRRTTEASPADSARIPLIPGVLLPELSRDKGGGAARL
jgi:hypothetical protein